MGCKVDLGGGLAPTPGHISVDIMEGADVVWDLNKGLPKDYNFGGIEGIRCHHLIEHLDTIIPLLNDCYEQMLPGAIMEISTPYAGTKQWYQDPTHKRAYIPDTFLYFVKNSPFEKEQKEYGISARFEIVKAERGEGVDSWQLFVVLKKPEL